MENLEKILQMKGNPTICGALYRRSEVSTVNLELPRIIKNSVLLWCNFRYVQMNSFDYMW